MVFDVTDPKAVSVAIERIEQETGAIDVLINNAGIQHRQPLEDFDHERWEALLRTNVSSVFYVGQAVARYMIGRKKGRIINIASVQSALARPGIAPYTATKGAIRNLTRGMCTDWARQGLQINAIAPGYFRTPLNAALVADADFPPGLPNALQPDGGEMSKNSLEQQSFLRATRLLLLMARRFSWMGELPQASDGAIFQLETQLEYRPNLFFTL